jgi:hypothetical protein
MFREDVLKVVKEKWEERKRRELVQVGRLLAWLGTDVGCSLICAVHLSGAQLSAGEFNGLQQPQCDAPRYFGGEGTTKTFEDDACAGP